LLDYDKLILCKHVTVEMESMKEVV